MYKYQLKRKGTFRTDAPRLKVYDYRGVIFFDSKEVKNFDGYITLPLISMGESKYYTNEKIYRVPTIARIKDYTPPKERDMRHNFSGFKVRFAKNPHKCSILHIKKLILFDTDFKNKPYAELMFILMHEVGHNWYETEHKCDEFAVNTMLRKGYTPHQIMNACDNVLSNKVYDRKENVLTQLHERL